MACGVSFATLVASLAEAWIEIKGKFSNLIFIAVASLAEAWIEIFRTPDRCYRTFVASLAEAWIEIDVGGEQDG